MENKLIIQTSVIIWEDSLLEYVSPLFTYLMNSVIMLITIVFEYLRDRCEQDQRRALL